MYQQQSMLLQLKTMCRQDNAVVAAMLYGSFALAEADEYSDLDVVLFVSDTAFNDEETQRKWLSRLSPVHLYFVNEFGVSTAIFENLVRGEFHFNKASHIADVIKGWHPDLYFPSLEATLLADKTGELSKFLQPFIHQPIHYGRELRQTIVNQCMNWITFGLAVMQRGEHARALEILSVLHRHLLKLIRIREQSTIHWLTPSRAAEQDLSVGTLARFAACTAPLNREALWTAYQNVWSFVQEIIAEAEDVTLPPALVTQVSSKLESRGGNVV